MRYDKRREVNLLSEQLVTFQDGICYFMECVILNLQELYTRETSLLKRETQRDKLESIWAMCWSFYGYFTPRGK